MEHFFYESSPMREALDCGKHYHDDYELYFLESGRCTYLINDKLYAVEPGDLVLIPRQILHSVTYPQRNSRMVFNCDEAFVAGLPLPDCAVYRNPAISGEIRKLFRKIEQEYTHPDAYSPLLLRGLVHRLLATLFRNPNLYPSDQRANHLIEAVLKDLNQDFCTDVTLTQVASRHCVSPAHLSRTFKRETGLCFNEYLSLLRLKKAELMLRQEPNLSISHIALSCGFNDSNYFSEKFRAAYGCSPSAFRKNED